MLITPSPKISIILPAFNAEDYISDAIESCLNQTFKDFELIVIDDCSTDSTYLKICNYKYDERVVIIKNAKNSGLIYTLNKALSIAKGDYIARMDADDICELNRLEKQVDFLDSNHDYVLIGAWYKIFGAKKRYITLPISDAECRGALSICSPFCHPVVMFRRDVIIKNNIFYNENFPHAEDYNFFQTLSLVGKVANLPYFLLNYRFHKNQVSNKFSGEQMESRISSTAKYLGVNTMDIPRKVISLAQRNDNNNEVMMKGLLEILSTKKFSLSLQEWLYIFKCAKFIDIIKFSYWWFK